MQRPIPLRTTLTLSAEQDGKSVDYTCTLVGYGRYGLQVTLPQILDRIYSLPATLPMLCTFVSVSTNQMLGFNTYVMGYERTEPPLMVLAFPQSLDGHNRRNALRWPVKVPMGYIAQGAEAYAERTETMDISLTGLQMTTGRVLEKGTVLSVTLDLPGETVIVSGEVVWSSFRGRRASAGVHFRRIGSAVEKALAQYLNGLERSKRVPSA